MNEQDQDQADYEEAPYVGQIVPPRTHVNATMREKLDTSYMAPARLDADDHMRWKSRGV
jgi:hypothetical protein